MKRVVGGVLAIMSIILIGCMPEGSYSKSETMLYSGVSVICDTTHLEDTVDNLQYRVDTLLLSYLGEQELAGFLTFTAKATSEWGVDTQIYNKAKVEFEKLNAKAQVIDYGTVLNDTDLGVYFQGDVMVVYTAYNASMGIYYFADTVGVYTIHQK